MNPEASQLPTKPSVGKSDKQMKVGKALSLVGGLLQLPIIIYFFLALFGLLESTQPITLYAEGDPKVMSGEMSAVLARLMTGTLLALTGLIISFIALFISDYRNRFLFWYTILLSIFWILSFPIGTAFGIVYLAIILVKIR